MKRPRDPDARRVHHLSVRLTLEEFITLREAADAAHQTPSDYARSAILRSRPPRRHNILRLEPAHFFQIRMLGVNLNQIARRLNSSDQPAPPELQPLLAHIHAALERALPVS